MGVGGAIVSVILTYFLSQQFGLVGAALGALSLDLILVFLVIPYACKLMRMSLKELVVNGLDDFRAGVRTLTSKISKTKGVR